jgi:hypothetical protein
MPVSCGINVLHRNRTSSNLCYSFCNVFFSYLFLFSRFFLDAPFYYIIYPLIVALICPNAGQYSLLYLVFYLRQLLLMFFSINSFSRSRASVLNFRLVHLDEPVLKEQKAQSFHRCTEQCLIQILQMEDQQFLIIIIICLKPN